VTHTNLNAGSYDLFMRMACMLLCHYCMKYLCFVIACDFIILDCDAMRQISG
jgi:hypothetical protein